MSRSVAALVDQRDFAAGADCVVYYQLLGDYWRDKDYHDARNHGVFV